MRAMMEHLPEEHEAHNLLVDGSEPQPPTDTTDPSVDCESRYYWSHTKWYDGYDDVGFIEAILDILPCEEYKFVRIGEESEDVEEKGEFWESDIHIRRSISW